VELALYTCDKATLIACYLPHPVKEHAYACDALARLSTTLPHHLVIVGGDLQRGWEGTSLKDLHVASPPYMRWVGPTISTFTPRHQPSKTTCIYHLSIWDPQHMSRQVGDTQTLPSPFLDHNCVRDRIHLPILIAAAIATPPPRQTLASIDDPISHPGTHPIGMDVQGGGRLLDLHLTSKGYGHFPARLYVPPVGRPSP